MVKCFESWVVIVMYLCVKRAGPRMTSNLFSGRFKSGHVLVVVGYFYLVNINGKHICSSVSAREGGFSPPFTVWCKVNGHDDFWCHWERKLTVKCVLGIFILIGWLRFRREVVNFFTGVCSLIRGGCVGFFVA